jgi:hypothetical protein
MYIPALDVGYNFRVENNPIVKLVNWGCNVWYIQSFFAPSSSHNAHIEFDYSIQQGMEFRLLDINLKNTASRLETQGFTIGHLTGNQLGSIVLRPTEFEKLDIHITRIEARWRKLWYRQHPLVPIHMTSEPSQWLIRQGQVLAVIPLSNHAQIYDIYDNAGNIIHKDITTQTDMQRICRQMAKQHTLTFP